MTAATPTQDALRVAVLEIEQHVAAAGWDAPVRVFALVRTLDAAKTAPELAAGLVGVADEHHLTAIEQEALPASQDLESLLAQLAWPGTVGGAAVAVERIVLPDDAEDLDGAELPQLLAHPQRRDVRIAAGVLRSGESWCAIRSRANDADDAVADAPELVPGLIEALATTLRD